MHPPVLDRKNSYHPPVAVISRSMPFWCKDGRRACEPPGLAPAAMRVVPQQCMDCTNTFSAIFILFYQDLFLFVSLCLCVHASRLAMSPEHVGNALVVYGAMYSRTCSNNSSEGLIGPGR